MKTIFLFEKLYVVKKNYLRLKKKYPKNLLLVKLKLVEKTSEELKIIEKFLNIKK